MIYTLGPDIGSRTGAFDLARLFEGRYRSRVRGSGTPTSNITAFGFPPPISSVITMQTDLGLTTHNLRVNGGDQGFTSGVVAAGNFRDDILFIGSRAGTSIFLNGHISCLIFRGAQTDTPTIERTEKYVASKTAGVTL
jgi:hypothetical protein